MDAYLDIETTGLSPLGDVITVVGVCRQESNGVAFRQLVGPEVTLDNVTSLLAGVKTLYTYNGARFDLVFLKSQLRLELHPSLAHRDLMYTCWDRGLYGGFKAVERYLGIERTVQGVSGRQAVELWWRYIRKGDNAALQLLLQYNEEDVLNLKALKEKLGID